MNRSERLKGQLASYHRRAARRHKLGLTTLGKPFKRHPNLTAETRPQYVRQTRRTRYHVEAQLNFRMGLTSRGTPRKRRANYHFLPNHNRVSHAELVRREGLARYRRRAAKFHEQGLTYNGRPYRRPLARVPSALELNWRKLRAGVTLPRFSLETTVFERSE